MAKRAWIFLVYIIAALYITNIGLGILQLPEVFANYIDKWVLLVAGVFLLIESFKYLREYPTY